MISLKRFNAMPRPVGLAIGEARTVL